MAKDVNFFGSWMDVPYVDLPQIGGGSARFTNIDDTTATAPDVSSTKYFYTAAGVRTKGTGATGSPSYQAKTVTPSETQQTVTADNTYDALSSVTVKGITASYVGSGVTRKSSTDLTVSGATITAPAGYYASAATKSVASTTRATPTISVNSSGLITATVTQSAGYVTAGTTSTTSQLSTQAGKTVTPSQSAQTAVASGKYTTGTITVAAIPSEYIVPEGSISITANGTDIDVSQYATADVAVPTGGGVNNQNKTVTPSESKQTITPDSGYTGLGTVTVNAIPTTYVGSGITQRSSSDLTVSGATVTAPAGYYASAASKSVTTMTLPTTTAAAATSGYTSKATISRSTSNQYINIPPGYNSAGGYYKISAVANGSSTPPATISGSSASLTTGTNTLTLSKTISVTPVVNAGYVSAGTAGNVTVTLTASVTTKGAATITPGTSNQTIASGTYLTGTQTIAGAASLTTANIKDGVNIFGVTGSYTSDATASAADIVNGKTGYVAGNKVTGSLVIQNYYTGSSTPSSSLGSNGDIYIQQ